MLTQEEERRLIQAARHAMLLELERRDDSEDEVETPFPDADRRQRKLVQLTTLRRLEIQRERAEQAKAEADEAAAAAALAEVDVAEGARPDDTAAAAGVGPESVGDNAAAAAALADTEHVEAEEAKAEQEKTANLEVALVIPEEDQQRKQPETATCQAVVAPALSAESTRGGKAEKPLEAQRVKAEQAKAEADKAATSLAEIAHRLEAEKLNPYETEALRLDAKKFKALQAKAEADQATYAAALAKEEADRIMAAAELAKKKMLEAQKQMVEAEKVAAEAVDPVESKDTADDHEAAQIKGLITLKMDEKTAREMLSLKSQVAPPQASKASASSATEKGYDKNAALFAKPRSVTLEIAPPSENAARELRAAALTSEEGVDIQDKNGNEIVPKKKSTTNAAQWAVFTRSFNKNSKFHSDMVPWYRQDQT